MWRKLSLLPQLTGVCKLKSTPTAVYGVKVLCWSHPFTPTSCLCRWYYSLLLCFHYFYSIDSALVWLHLSGLQFISYENSQWIRSSCQLVWQNIWITGWSMGAVLAEDKGGCPKKLWYLWESLISTANFIANQIFYVSFIPLHPLPLSIVNNSPEQFCRMAESQISQKDKKRTNVRFLVFTRMHPGAKLISLPY